MDMTTWAVEALESPTSLPPVGVYSSRRSAVAGPTLGVGSVFVCPPPRFALAFVMFCRLLCVPL